MNVSSNDTRTLLTVLNTLEQCGATFPDEACAYLALRAAELCADGSRIRDVVISRNGAVSAAPAADGHRETQLELRLLAARCLLVSNSGNATTWLARVAASERSEDLVELFENKLRPLNRDAMERLLGRLAFSDFENPFHANGAQFDEWLEAR